MHFNISHDAKRRSIVYVHAKLSLCIIYVTYESSVNIIIQCAMLVLT